MPVPLLLFVAAVAIVCRRWGASALWYVAAGVCLLGAAGAVAEHLWGPQWSWSFGRHGLDYAARASIQALCCIAMGVWQRARRRVA